MPENFDKSNFLGTNSKIKSLLPFNPPKNRRLAQGGSAVVSAKRREDVIYDHAHIKLNLQRKSSIPGFAQASNREHTWGNLYRHPVRDVSPDYNGSSMKIQEQALKGILDKSS